MYLAHLCGCAFHWLAIFNINKGFKTTWLDVAKLVDAVWYERYVNALYFSVLTMITVGLQPLTKGYAQTNCFNERLFSIFTCLILAGMFAYSINQLGNILKDMSQNSAELRIKIRDINHYMKHRRVSKGLQLKIRRYLEYMHEEVRPGLTVRKRWAASAAASCWST